MFKSLFNELIPKDFDVTFPILERVSPKEKQQTDSEFINMITQCLDAGLIDKKVARREIHERHIFDNFNQDDIDRIEGNEGEMDDIETEDAMDSMDRPMTDQELEALEDLDECVENEENGNLKLQLILVRSKLKEEGEEAAMDYIRNEDMLREYFNIDKQ